MEEAPRRKPGPAPRISRDDVVAVARKLHADGRLTMTAIAAELDVTVGALYRYVPDKAAILSLLAVEERDASQMPDAALGWPDWLSTMIRTEASFWADHPYMQSVAAITPPTQPGLQAVDTALQLLTDAGLAPLDAIAAITVASYLSFGLGLAERSRIEQVDPEVAKEVWEILQRHGVTEGWSEIRERLIAMVMEWVESRLPGDG